jgi:hypothetical protein
MTENGKPALAVSPRVVLMTLGTVRALLGCVTETVKADVEAGKFLWVFDFSMSKNAPDTGSSALRFWFREMLNPQAVADMSIKNVIDEILPPARAAYASGEFYLKFMTNRLVLHEMRHRWNWGLGPVRRKHLAQFLSERWIGRTIRFYDRGQRISRSRGTLI